MPLSLFSENLCSYRNWNVGDLCYQMFMITSPLESEYVKKILDADGMWGLCHMVLMSASVATSSAGDMQNNFSFLCFVLLLAFSLGCWFSICIKYLTHIKGILHTFLKQVTRMHYVTAWLITTLIKPIYLSQISLGFSLD